MSSGRTASSLVAGITALSLALASPLVSQTVKPADPSAGPARLVVYPGATVRVKAPSLGNGEYIGKFASASVRGVPCLGAAVTLPGSGGAPSLILLKGISRLEVDRRTNQDAMAIGLDPPGPDDWQVIDLAALRAQDSACPVQGKPAG